MEYAGKALPVPDDIEQIVDKGFDHVELHLDTPGAAREIPAPLWELDDDFDAAAAREALAETREQVEAGRIGADVVPDGLRGTDGDAVAVAGDDAGDGELVAAVEAAREGFVVPPNPIQQIERLGAEATDEEIDRAVETTVDRVERGLDDAEGDAEVTTIHTPHVKHGLDLEAGAPAYEACDRLAQELDATLVVHAAGLHPTMIPDLESVMEAEYGGFDADYAYENQPGMSVQYIEDTIATAGRPLYLDTAHLGMGEHADALSGESTVPASAIDADVPEQLVDETGELPRAQAALAKLLTEYEDQIEGVHLADASRETDGLPFGEGELDMRGQAWVVQTFYDGPTPPVVEVPPGAQEENAESLRTWEAELDPQAVYEPSWRDQLAATVLSESDSVAEEVGTAVRKGWGAVRERGSDLFGLGEVLAGRLGGDEEGVDGEAAGHESETDGADEDEERGRPPA